MSAALQILWAIIVMLCVGFAAFWVIVIVFGFCCMVWDGWTERRESKALEAEIKSAADRAEALRASASLREPMQPSPRCAAAPLRDTCPRP